MPEIQKWIMLSAINMISFVSVHFFCTVFVKNEYQVIATKSILQSWKR